MQPGSPPKARYTATPTTPVTTTRLTDSSKSSSGTPRITSPRQDGKAGFDTPLRMHDFYSADPQFNALTAALASGKTSSSDTKKLLANFALQLGQIRTTVFDAEKSFSPYSIKDCAVFLRAAKANQVRLLSDIDSAANHVLPDSLRKTLHDACINLGHGLSKMMVQANELEQAKAIEGTSPPRGQQKRAQSHPDSPLMTATSPKRRKVDTPPSPPNAKVSSPDYQPAAVRDSPPSRKGEDGNSDATASTSTTSTTCSTPTTSTTVTNSPLSPLKDRLVQSPLTSPNPTRSANRYRPSAQPRPRPASQLFAAPPNFGTEAKAASSPAAQANRNLKTEPADPPVSAPASDAR